MRTSLSWEQLPFRAGVSEGRPSYNKDYLDELRNSTPSKPTNADISLTAEDDESGKAIDITSKFGPLAPLTPETSSIIPTEAEIREKKERRARLAKEQDFLSLDAEASDEESNSELTLRPKEKWPETRLVPDDEDIAEGFDAYVDDGKISLGRKAEREQERKRRAEMADLIAEAQGGGPDDESNDSDAERNAAYEAAQTRAGTYGSRDRAGEKMQRSRTPPRITPLPGLGAVVQRLRTALREMEEARAAKVRKLEGLRAEKKEIAEREVWIQAQLRETGERYEKLRVEAGLGGGTPGLNGVDGLGEGGKTVVNRGLESFGTTPVAGLSDASDG